MRTGIAASFVLLFTIGEVVSGWKHASENDFLRAVGGHNQALVAFVEPSTTGSKVLEQEWMKIADTEKALVSVDCTAQAQLCKDYDVISYPALRYFDGHGKMTPYRGPRRASSIVSYLRRAARPTVTALNEKKLIAFQSIDDVVIVAHINPQDEHIVAAFNTLAARYKDRASFGWLETSGATTVACYKTKEDETSSISDLTAIRALPAFVESCMTPLIGEFTRKNELKFLNAGKSLVYYFATDLAQREAFVESFRAIAKKYKEYLLFLTIDANEYDGMLPMLGLSVDSLPAVSVQNPAFGQVFPFRPDGKVTPEGVDQFITSIAGGQVQPWSPSAPPPQEAEAPAHDEL